MPRRQSSRRRTQGWMTSRRAISAVEFSIAAPIFFFAIFASIELSRIELIRNLAHDATYDTARFCMVDGATEDEAAANAQRILDLAGAQGVTTTINDGQGLSDDSPTIKVTIAVDLGQNSLVMPWIFAGKTITSTTELKTERYHGYFNANDTN